MEFRDETLHRQELDDMGLTYLTEHLNRGLTLSKQLTKVISNKHGRLISWLPDDVKVPEPSYFDAGLISSRPLAVRSRGIGNWVGELVEPSRLLDSCFFANAPIWRARPSE